VLVVDEYAGTGVAEPVEGVRAGLYGLVAALCGHDLRYDALAARLGPRNLASPDSQVTDQLIDELRRTFVLNFALYCHFFSRVP
jgi:hypothetical protein